MAHSRRKFVDLHATNKSQLPEQALHSIDGLYKIERLARETTDEDRWRIPQEKRRPLSTHCVPRCWPQRDLVLEGSAITKVLDYSLKLWAVQADYVEDGAVPIDNNAVKNQIRPWAFGRSN